MGADPQNQQYGAGASLFGQDASAYGSTGAPGTAGITDSPPGVGGGAVIASPVVSIPGYSSQLPEGMPRLPVTQGDTSAMSDDSPVPATGDPLTGLSLADITQTGAGEGSDITAGHHPNSTAGGGR